MRVVDREAFLRLPAGTIYADGVRWCFGGLSVKGETITAPDGRAIDWCCLDPAMIEYDDPEQMTARLEEMLASGASYPMAEAEGRDGLFEAAAVFLVFERADLERLRGMIDAAIGLAGEGE